MHEPRVYVGPEPSRRISYEKRVNYVALARIAGWLAAVIGSLGGWAFLVWGAGALAGRW